MVIREGKGLAPPLSAASSEDGSFDVLVYHAPGAHPGDVRKLRHTYSEEIISAIEGEALWI